MRTDPMVGKWAYVFFDSLGVLDEKHRGGGQGPCPMCGGKDRFRFDNKEGRGSWYCNHCGAGDGYILYMHTQHITDFKEAKRICVAKYGDIASKPVVVKMDCSPMLNRLWRGSSQDVKPVLAYLASRGITKIPDGVLHEVLRYHPECPWSDGAVRGTAPAMLARVWCKGKPMTIHRTFLTTDVPKRKMVMPHNGKLCGAYIPLGPEKPTMGCAEGIETSLSAFQLYGVVTYATYCASQLERFSPPTTVDKLHIFCDNDDNFTGQAAGYALANRLCLSSSELDVRIHVPPVVNSDVNDILRSKGENHDVSRSPTVGSCAA